MLQLLKRFWRSLLIIGALVGLLYLPVDIAGMPTAIQPFADLLVLVDREWLLIGFAAILSLYIMWMDARPSFVQWLLKRKRRFIQIQSLRTSILIDPVDGKPLQGRFRRVYVLPVRNVSGRTLKRVQVAFAETGPYGRLPLIGEDGQVATDLHPGDVASFKLGETDLGVGSTQNVFDSNDERYATTANFKAETIGGWVFTSGTRLQGTELERVSQIKPEGGVTRYKLVLIASAEDVDPEVISMIVTFDYKTAKVTVAPARPLEKPAFKLLPVPRPQ